MIRLKFGFQLKKCIFFYCKIPCEDFTDKLVSIFCFIAIFLNPCSVFAIKQNSNNSINRTQPYKLRHYKKETSLKRKCMINFLNV